MFFQASHGHVDLPRRYSMAYFCMRLWRSSTKTGGFHSLFLSSVFPMQSTKGHLSEVSTLSENLTKTTVKPISPKLQFFPAKMRNFPTKKAAGVCFPNRVFFSQTQLFHRFLGWLGDSPPHTFHKNTSTARSWINIPTKKHRPVAGEVKPRQSLSKDRYFKAFDSSGLHGGLEWV